MSDINKVTFVPVIFLYQEVFLIESIKNPFETRQEALDASTNWIKEIGNSDFSEGFLTTQTAIKWLENGQVEYFPGVSE